MTTPGSAVGLGVEEVVEAGAVCGVAEFCLSVPRTRPGLLSRRVAAVETGGLVGPRVNHHSQRASSRAANRCSDRRTSRTDWFESCPITSGGLAAHVRALPLDIAIKAERLRRAS